MADEHHVDPMHEYTPTSEDIFNNSIYNRINSNASNQFLPMRVTIRSLTM